MYEIQLVRKFCTKILFCLYHCLSTQTFLHRHSPQVTLNHTTINMKVNPPNVIRSYPVNRALHYSTVEFQNSTLTRVLFVDFWILASND